MEQIKDLNYRAIQLNQLKNNLTFATMISIIHHLPPPTIIFIIRYLG